MSEEFGAPVSYAGIVSVIISVCTIISSLLSDRTTKRFGAGWSQGYLIVAIIQICISAAIFISLPIWKKFTPVQQASTEVKVKPLTAKEIVSVKGAVACFITFFCYCSLEQTTMLWASSFMVARNGISAQSAASFASLFFIGITVGRAVNGFLTIKFSDRTLIRAGQTIIATGIILLFIPNDITTLCGFYLTGLGCAPIYPSIIHMTPSLFGAEKSQAMIGVQMASAYLGSCIAPPVYGLIANHISPSALLIYLVAFLVLMAIMHETVVAKTKKQI